MTEWELLGVVTAVPSNLILQDDDIDIVSINEIYPLVLDHHAAYNKYLLKETTTDTYFIFEQYNSEYWVKYSIQAGIINELLIEHIEESKKMMVFDKRVDYFSNDIEQIFKIWREDDKTYGYTSDPFRLDMVPPDAEKSHKLTSYTYENTDPKVYTLHKYSEALFSLHVPLAYFVKSNLVRLRNICKTAYGSTFISAYQTCLIEQLLEIKDFDERYTCYHLLLESYKPNTYFQQNRRDCMKRYRISPEPSGNNKAVSDLCTILKAREIKLQLIILLELIYQNNLDSNFKDFEKRYRQKLKKRALNISKKRVNLKKTTSINNKVEEKKNISSSVDYCEQLDLYLDKLAIQEILLETENDIYNPKIIGNEKLIEYKKNILKENNESSSSGFISFILVPYFMKKLPNAAKFIIKKFKGPSLKKRTSETRATNTTPNNISIDGEAPLALSHSKSSEVTPSRKSFVSHSEMEPNKRPALLRRSTVASLTPDLLASRTDSNLSEFLEADTKSSRSYSTLLRTKSDLSMNYLHKRQLSVSNLTSETAKRRSSKPGGLEPVIERNIPITSKVLSTHSFRRVGKRKLPVQNSDTLSDTTLKRTPTTVDITATPLKNTNITGVQNSTSNNIIESPINNETKNSTPISKSLVKQSQSPGVFKSPQPTISSPVDVLATPLVKLGENRLTNRLVPTIVESPVQSNNDTSNNDKHSIKHIPAKKKVKRRLFAG